MTSKSNRRIESEKDLTEPASEQHLSLRSTATPLPVADSAPAQIVYVDDSPFFAYGAGVASITLTARRQIGDASGRVIEDRVITGLLRAPLSVMLQLRGVLDGIEKLAQQQAAAIAETPDALPN